MSIAVRASGYIYFKEWLNLSETSHIIYEINKAYGSNVEAKREPNNIVKIDIFGSNMIEYEPLQNILKDNKKYLSDEVAIGEWVESDGGFIYDPEEDED